MSTLITEVGRPFSANRWKRVENMHLSNALLQSKTVTIGLIPLRCMSCTTSDTSHVHCVVDVLALYQNCKLSLESKSPHSSKTTISKTFRINEDPAMALYDPGSAGFFREDFMMGRNEQASMLLVTVP